MLDAIADFRFDEATIAWLREGNVIDERTADYLSVFRFGGDVDGYPEGEVFFPYSPILTVSGTFATDAIDESDLVLSASTSAAWKA